MTPATYRDGGRGIEVRYTTVPTSHGPLVIARTDRGLCAVILGDERALRDELPNATITRVDDPEVAAIIGGIDDHVDASLFQLRVWETLRSDRTPRASQFCSAK